MLNGEPSFVLSLNVVGVMGGFLFYAPPTPLSRLAPPKQQKAELSRSRLLVPPQQHKRFQGNASGFGRLVCQIRDAEAWRSVRAAKELSCFARLVGTSMC